MRKPRTTSLAKNDGTVVCRHCVIAATPFARMKGLLGLHSLDVDEGIVLRPAGSIHMFFMRFAIDAVFCDRQLTVIDVERELAPWRIAARKGAKIVIEMAPGAAAELRPGDRLALATIDA